MTQKVFFSSSKCSNSSSTRRRFPNPVRGSRFASRSVSSSLARDADNSVRSCLDAFLGLVRHLVDVRFQFLSALDQGRTNLRQIVQVRDGLKARAEGVELRAVAMVALPHRFGGAGDHHHQFLDLRRFLFQIFGSARAGLLQFGLELLFGLCDGCGALGVRQTFREICKVLYELRSQARAGLIAERTGSGNGGAVGIQSGFQHPGMIHLKVSLQGYQYTDLSTEDRKTSADFARLSRVPDTSAS